MGEWRYSSTHSLTSALVADEWSASRPGRITPRERRPPWYPLDRRLGEPQSRSGRGGEQKNSQPPLIVKKFFAFYRTRKFITVLTTARHWSLSWARCIQSTLTHPISLRSILILSSRLCVCLPRYVIHYLLIIRLITLGITALSFLRVHNDKRACDLDVGLVLTSGVEAEYVGSVRPLKSYKIWVFYRFGLPTKFHTSFSALMIHAPLISSSLIWSP
jgi:hypothetical protein